MRRILMRWQPDWDRIVLVQVLPRRQQRPVGAHVNSFLRFSTNNRFENWHMLNTCYIFTVRAFFFFWGLFTVFRTRIYLLTDSRCFERQKNSNVSNCRDYTIILEISAGIKLTKLINRLIKRVHTLKWLQWHSEWCPEIFFKCRRNLAYTIISQVFFLQQSFIVFVHLLSVQWNI